MTLYASEVKLAGVKPRIAVCTTLGQAAEDTLALACGASGCTAVEFRLDARALGAAPAAVNSLRLGATTEAVEVRFHYPLGPLDLSHGDPHEANRALASMREACDLAAKCHVRYLTVHLGLPRGAPATRVSSAVDRLAALVDHGRTRDVTVCLENLRWGLTSEPDAFLDLVCRSGAAVTFDVGHASSSDAAKNGYSAARFARLVSEHVRNAHVYEREDPHHIAPDSLDNIASALEVLLETACDWWVVELFDADEIRRTMQLLGTFMEAHYPGGTK